MGSIRSAFVKVNSDPDYRARFIKNPVGTLRKEGFTLTTEQQEELRRLVGILMKQLPELGELPAGYDTLINEVRGKHHAGKTGEVGPLII